MSNCRLSNLIAGPKQDKMIDDGDSMRLCEYCFDVCEALGTAIQGKDVSELDETVRTAFKDFERWVDPNSAYRLY